MSTDIYHSSSLTYFLHASEEDMAIEYKKLIEIHYSTRQYKHLDKDTVLKY